MKKVFIVFFSDNYERELGAIEAEFDTHDAAFNYIKEAVKKGRNPKTFSIIEKEILESA